MRDRERCRIRLVGALFLCSLPTTKKKKKKNFSMWDNYLWTQVLDRRLLFLWPFFPSSSSCCSSLWKATSSPKHAKHLCVFCFVSQEESENKKANRANCGNFSHILYMDDIQVWKAKDRLLFFVKFPRKQILFHFIVLRHHSQSFSPSYKNGNEGICSNHRCVKHWSTAK